MKKTIMLLFLLFIPFMINAEEKCSIVNGNGKDIGSEIACGTEYFYVIEDKEDSVRMLAKYNLDMGYEFNKVTVSAERYSEFQTICNTKYSAVCSALFDEEEFENFDGKLYPDKNEDGTYTYMAYKLIMPDEIKQNSKAIGAHGDKNGNPEFPEYGVVGHIAQSAFDEYSDHYANNSYADFTLDDIIFLNGDDFEENDYKYDNYKKLLEDKGVYVKSLDMLSLKELNNIVYKLSSTNLPLEEWANTANWIKHNIGYENDIYIVGSLREYLPDGYEWIYSTTYWTKTAISNGDLDGYADQDVFFIDTLGYLCNTLACDISVGAGIRPVVEISKDSINYNLTTTSDKGGSLESNKSHLVGDTIVLNAVAETGYKLDKLIVITDSGVSLEIGNEDIIKNSNGTISINPNKFVMPLENVHIEAKWVFVNPKTGVSSFIGVIFTLMLIAVSGFFMIKNCNNSYEL